eukprot:TRINITY_DN14196_c0_g5_i2.p1 TRINITY_DN14196_c0_g5~~TRINITY_DN14196_c0_g5_i2.p1  ORF type:complete len:326 (+),score=97.01 TRINITY_DN14196_c0_g5_i2:609-1586(+)
MKKVTSKEQFKELPDWMLDIGNYSTGNIHYMRRIDTEMDLTATQGRCRCVSAADISFNTDHEGNSKDDASAGAIGKTELEPSEGKGVVAPEENKLLFNSPANPAINNKGEEKKGFKFLSAASLIPKKGEKGEDAYFITPRVLGVADGVSGWYQYRIDAAKFSRELMENCNKEALSAIESSPSAAVDLVDVLAKAYSNTRSIGSSTATLIAINDDSLHGVNLGDSGFMCFSKRGGEYVCHGVSKEKQHDFNTPFQLCNVPSEDYIKKLREVLPEGDVRHLTKIISKRDLCQDSPSDSDKYTIKLHQDDIVVMGTDGTSSHAHRILC